MRQDYEIIQDDFTQICHLYKGGADTGITLTDEQIEKANNLIEKQEKAMQDLLESFAK